MQEVGGGPFEGEDLVGDEECRIVQGQEEIRGLPVHGADIGCSGEGIEDLAAQAGEDIDLDGQEIDYMIGEYQLIGIIDGQETVIQSVTTRG